MKRFLIFLFLTALLSSCNEQDLPLESKTEITFQYEGSIVLNTPNYLVTKADDKYILYDAESGRRWRGFLDFGEVKYEENGVIKSRYVFLQKTFAFILENGLLETYEFNSHYNNVQIYGDYILLNKTLYTGDFKQIGASIQGEIVSQTEFEDGARLTVRNDEFSSESEHVRTIKLDDKPINLTEIYKSDNSTLYSIADSSGLILENTGGIFRLPFSVSNDIYDVCGDGDSNIYILYRDSGIIKRCNIYSLRLDSVPYMSARVSTASADDKFFETTILSPWVLDKNGEILLRGETITVYGDVLSTHQAQYMYEADRLTYIRDNPDARDHITLYNSVTEPISSAHILSRCSDCGEHLMMFNYDTTQFSVITQTGEVIYQTDHIEYPLILDSFGSAVLTKDKKVQFITCDGKALEVLDGWSEELTQYTPRQNCVYENGKLSYWYVVFGDPECIDLNAPQTYTNFRYYPETGDCEVVRY